MQGALTFSTIITRLKPSLTVLGMARSVDANETAAAHWWRRLLGATSIKSTRHEAHLVTRVPSHPLRGTFEEGSSRTGFQLDCPIDLAAGKGAIAPREALQDCPDGEWCSCIPVCWNQRTNGVSSRALEASARPLRPVRFNGSGTAPQTCRVWGGTAYRYVEMTQ
jgi:hypothetical protein